MTTVLQCLNAGLIHAMEVDKNVFIIGEDIVDPYGGAFKVTRGISTLFPNRVLSTPISEAAITGVATGMAMRGLRPVVEIMFGDFTTLIVDQVVNHAAKFGWVYKNKISVPIVIRTPMGGRRGYGPTHSQSLERLFLGIPGLRVIAPNTLSDPAILLESAIQVEDPVLFIEHKLLYARQKLEIGKGDLVDAVVEQCDHRFPTFKISFSPKPQVTIATYGYNFELVRQAVIELIYEQELFSEIILFSQINPIDISPLVESVNSTERLLTVEEGNKNYGWGAEIVARTSEVISKRIRFQRVGALDFPIANSKTLENAILPSIAGIKLAIKDLM
jgi:pyruvate/2-oxoglutarate/acetoin dehydrogenase E1 component